MSISKFSEFFLMSPEDVQKYVVEVLRFFPPEEETVCTEIGDGNINYVFLVKSKKDGRSIVVKQADRLLRSSGRPLDIYRGRIEAGALRLQGASAPSFVPKVYYYDETMAALAMEDISDYKNLRKELLAGRVYEHLAENLSEFLSEYLLPTTDLVLPPQEKKRRRQYFTNPELCDITEDLVLTEPYYNYKNRNIITPGNEEFVESYLYKDQELLAEAGKLRNNFMNNSQALLHGDLHGGSIFANEQGIKIIDPEFAFYGPIGYDIGSAAGSFFFAWANFAYTAPEKKDVMTALGKAIQDTFDLTAEKIAKAYDKKVSLPLYRTEGFRKSYLSGIMSDAYGYAGMELIRRVVGDSKVMEITAVQDLDKRIPMERTLIKMGIWLIKERNQGLTGDAVTAAFQLLLQ